ncbi:MAG: DUF4397 domain-containing protein [Ilumatobacteraceae bacterium]
MGITMALSAAVLVSAGAATASARPADDATAATGWVRFGHFAPAQAPVDLYVDGNQVATGVAFKTVSGYLNLPAGTHTFAVKPAGDAGAAYLFSAEAGVQANNAETIAAVTTRDGLAVTVYDDALATPTAGQSLVRFIHSAPDVAAVDIAIEGGPIVASNVPYASATPYVPIDPGTYNVDVLEAGTQNVVVKVAGWSIQPGVQSSVIVIKGLDGKLDVVPVLDAAAVPAAPSGGVQTGYGGMAPKPGSATRWPYLAVPALLLAGIAVVMLRKRGGASLVSVNG